MIMITTSDEGDVNLDISCVLYTKPWNFLSHALPTPNYCPIPGPQKYILTRSLFVVCFKEEVCCIQCLDSGEILGWSWNGKVVFDQSQPGSASLKFILNDSCTKRT